MITTFKEVGKSLLLCGYSPLPINYAEKSPVPREWQNLNIDVNFVNQWERNKDIGVGIRCGDGVYGVDIDVKNKAMSNLIMSSVLAKFGDAPCRVGNAPKCLLVYAGDCGKTKVNIILADKEGAEHKIEILGKGQQFVAYGIHKDTKKPYEWTNSPLHETDSWELSNFDHDEFLRWFKAELSTQITGKGWKVLSITNYLMPGSGEVDDLSMVFAAQPLDISNEQVDANLEAYSPVGLDYDAWLKVGMALFHQFEGSDEGFNRWNDWSKQDEERYNELIMPGKWKSFGGSANPVTMASVIHHVKEAGVVISTAKNWIAQIDECKDKHALEQLVMKRISADKSIGVVDLVDLEAAVKTKFSEFGVTLRADPLRKLFKPKQKRGLPDIGTNDLPLETMDNLSAVCDNNDVVVRYNVIKKDDEILIKDASWSIDNAKSASITWVRSACHKVEMKTTNIKNFITLLADGNQYNPVVEWVTSKPWDGVSRLNEFYATVRENDAECSPTMKKTLMLRWMVGAIAAAFTPTGSMVRGVLVFQGEQYTGKTRWIDALAPKELDLIKTGRSLVVHDKDSVKQILSCWISELGELDATFKKSDIAALKAFITSDMDELRRPYAAAESQYARRTVFAASVNEPKFLQDDTGNSRFWVLPITSIDHAHKLDMQQVWAEFYVLWNNGKGEQHFLSKDEMDMLNRHNEHFSAPDPIFEMIHSHLDWDNFDPKDCEWKQVSDVLRWIEKDNPTKYETILAGKAIQKLNLGHNKKSNGKRLVAVPKTRIFIKASDFNDRVLKAPTLDDDIPF